MSNLNKIAGLGTVVLLVLLGVYVKFFMFKTQSDIPAPVPVEEDESSSHSPQSSIEPAPPADLPTLPENHPSAPETPSPVALPAQKIFTDVPFTAQAPEGNWSDPRQQHGCEEASLLMAHYWTLGKSLNAAIALDEIFKLSAFEVKLRGHAHDTSAADTMALWRDYYHHDGAYLLENVNSVQPIKESLAQGGLVIAPTNGRKLGNPNFTSPGPDRHMLVIVGYDDRRGVFITNDPGTRKGRNYVYSYETLLAAVRDYPTGEEAPLTGPVRKTLIVVFK